MVSSQKGNPGIVVKDATETHGISRNPSVGDLEPVWCAGPCGVNLLGSEGWTDDRRFRFHGFRFHGKFDRWVTPTDRLVRCDEFPHSMLRNGNPASILASIVLVIEGERVAGSKEEVALPDRWWCAFCRHVVVLT